MDCEQPLKAGKAGQGIPPTPEAPWKPAYRQLAFSSDFCPHPLYKKEESDEPLLFKPELNGDSLQSWGRKSKEAAGK